MALIRETALDKATRKEEKRAKKEKRPINPENIQALADWYTRHNLTSPTAAATILSSYTSQCFRGYGWVEPTGQEETSAFQANYPKGQPRKIFQTDSQRLAGSTGALGQPSAGARLSLNHFSSSQARFTPFSETPGNPVALHLMPFQPLQDPKSR